MKRGPAFALVFLSALCVACAFASIDAQNEVPPDKSRPCFPGAWYRKAVSSVDHWTGIEAVVTLPTFVPDESRLRANGRPRDNCSIYLGGRGGETEIDAGVLWEVIREPDGSISKVGKAYRPFWRNKKWFNAPAEPKFYYYPGDTIRMRVWTEEADKLKIRVELLSRADQPTGLPNQPISVFEESFEAPGWGPDRPQEFKRVTAIDQAGNEGEPAQPTKARVENCVFEVVYLMRDRNERRPFLRERFTDMRCPQPDPFLVEAHNRNLGGERIDIHPGGR